MLRKQPLEGAIQREQVGFVFGDLAQGSCSFKPYDAPEVMNAEQAGQFLQIDHSTVIELADIGKLPGRKLGGAWRFSRAALVASLSNMPPERR